MTQQADESGERRISEMLKSVRIPGPDELIRLNRAANDWRIDPKLNEWDDLTPTMHTPFPVIPWWFRAWYFVMFCAWRVRCWAWRRS